MERLSDIVNSIKERITNPFVFSFILSWLVYNWQVSIAFLWNNHDDFNLIHFINRTATDWDCWAYPLCAALSYTFVVPIAMNAIRAFNAWIISWGNDWVFEISKESNVSTEKYLELRENLKKNSDTISEMINTESRRITAHDETKKSLAETQDKLVKTEGEYQQQIKTLNLARQSEVAKLEANLLEIMNRNELTHDTKIIAGQWLMIEANEQVYIQDRRFVINGEPDVINLFERNNNYIRFVVTKVNKTRNEVKPFAIYYELSKVSDVKFKGFMNGLPITFERTAQEG